MTLRPGAKDWTIKEQIVEDKGGLTLQFEVLPGGETLRLRIVSDDIPFGNIHIYFDAETGEMGGSGFHVAAPPKVTWIREVVPNA